MVRTGKFTYSYRILTNTDCPDPVSTSTHRSILLHADNDNNMASIEWTGYLDWDEGVKNYEIWFKLDDQPYKQLGVINGNHFEDTVKNDGFEHCFAVRANEKGGNGSYSWSNTSCVTLAPEVMPYNVITPNGDNKNEYFVIENIEFYPNSLLSIFNRWGKKIVEFRGYKNDWSGRSNGQVLPVATYFYELDLNDDRATRKTINGMITVLY